MRLAGDIVRIRDDKQSLLERWYDEKGHILVVGEAAHRLNVSYHIQKPMENVPFELFLLFPARKFAWRCTRCRRRCCVGETVIEADVQGRYEMVRVFVSGDPAAKM